MIKEIEKTIIKYETDDGKLFNSLSDAENHENYLKLPKAYIVAIRNEEDPYQEIILSVHKSYPSKEDCSHEFFSRVYEFILKDWLVLQREFCFL